jgi:hypothetical protein
MNFLITGLEVFETQKKCVPKDEFLGFAAYFTVVDMVMTMLLPFIIISITNTLITVKLLGTSFSRRYKKRQLRSNSKTKTFANVIPLKDVEKLSDIYENEKLNDIINTNKSFLNETYNCELNTCPRKTKNNIEKLIAKKRRDKNIDSNFETLNKRNKSATSKDFDIKSQYPLNRISVSNISKRDKVYSRTTRVLLSLSTMFLILVRKYIFSRD